MRYLKNRPNQVWDNISYIMWPRYAASNIFFSSTLDNILPQVKSGIFYFEEIEFIIIYLGVLQQLFH